jgi:hypothetical protein
MPAAGFALSYSLETVMNDSSGIRPVHHRRKYPDLPKRKQKEKKEKGGKEEGSDHEEEPRKGPPPLDGNSTIDLTA